MACAIIATQPGGSCGQRATEGHAHRRSKTEGNDRRYLCPRQGSHMFSKTSNVLETNCL